MICEYKSSNILFYGTETEFNSTSIKEVARFQLQEEPPVTETLFQHSEG